MAALRRTAIAVLVGGIAALERALTLRLACALKARHVIALVRLRHTEATGQTPLVVALRVSFCFRTMCLWRQLTQGQARSQECQTH